MPPPGAHSDAKRSSHVQHAASAFPEAYASLSTGTFVLGLVPMVSGRSFVGQTPSADSSRLRLELVGSDTTAYGVVATLIVGPTEVLAWDAHYHVADAQRMADRIAATGKRLAAIVISHPDHDHFAGAATLVERFPGTPVYMTAKAIEWYSRHGPQAFQNEKSRRPELFPDSLVTPQLLPSLHLSVDGETAEVLPDLAGDVVSATNSVLWIPSLRAALVSDLAFDGVHLWLGSSDEASRAAWRAALKRVTDMHPAIVVAGHKRDVHAPDTPGVLAFTDQYLRDFETLRRASPDADVLRTAMLTRYPELTSRILLTWGARAAFQKPSAR